MVQRFGALSPLFAVLGGATTFNGGGIIGGFNEWLEKRRDSKKPITFSDEQLEGITYLKDNGLLTKEKIELLQGYDSKQKDALNLMAEEGLDIADAIKEVGESAQEGGGLFDLFREKGVKAFSAIGMALGNAAISVGIQLALSTAIKLINEFLTVQQRLSESAKSFGNQLKSTNSDLDSYKSKIAEQRAIVEDNKSSIENVTTARSTLYELQKQMIDAYGIEKDAIKEIADAFDGQTQAIDRNIEKLKERQYQDAVDKYNEENKSIFLPKQKNVLDENGITYTTKEMTPYDYFLEKMEQHQESLYKFANDSNSELQEVYNKHAKKNGWNDPSKVIGHVDQFIDFYDDYLAALDTIYNSLDSQMTENEYRQLKNFASSKRASVKSISEDGSDLYSQELSHQLRTAHSDTYELLNQLYADYTRAKTKETQDEIIHAYSDAINEVKNSGEFSQGLIQALEELHPDLYAQVANWTFEVKIEANEDHLKDSIKTALDNLKSANGGVEVTSDELRDWDKSKHTYEENQAYDNFAGIADTYDISFNELVSQSEKSAGLLSNELRDFDKFLNQSGIDIANFEKRVDTSTLNSTKNLKSKFEAALKSVRGNYKNTTDAAVAAWKIVERAEERAADKTKDITGEQLMKIEGDLSKLKNDIFDSKGNVKTTTFKNKDFLAAFDNIPDHIDPAIKALDKFKKVVSTTTDKSEIQDAFDELATSYVYNLDEMKGLNEENAKYVEGALSQGGVVNAAEVVASALAKTRAETALSTIEDKLNTAGKLELTEANQVVSESTLETVNGLVAQTDAADGTQKMLANLLIQQMLLNGSTINTQGSQDQLRALAQTAGYARGEIEGLIAAMALSSTLNSLGVSDAQKRRYTNAEGSERTNLINNRRNLEVKKTTKNINEALAAARMSGGLSGGSGGNSGGSNKEPSKTDKEWDWAARKAELLQRDNDRLREAVNSEYVILQDRKANIVDYNKAMEKLEDVKGQLTAMGVDVEGEEFQNLINTIDLSGAADDITSNVDSIEGEYAKIIDLSDEAAVKDFFGVSGEGEGAINREIQLMAQYSKIMDELAETSDYASKTLDENGRGKLSIIEDLIESDKQQIEFYKQQKAQYATEAEGYKEEILKAFDDENEALQWIKDVEEGNVNPEKWEQLSTYDSNDQKAKDKYESVDRMLKSKQKEEEADDNLHKKMLQLVEDEQNRFQIQLNIVKAKQEEVQSLIDEAQHELDMKEILGEVVTESDYQHLIDLNDDLIASYREQISVLRDQADELDEGEGAWYDVQSQIRDCESAIRDAVKQQAEWNDTILRMPVENISRFLKLVQNLGQTLKNWLSVNDAKGIAQNAEQIQTAWTTAYDQIADDELGLMKQLEDYEELLENYDLGSTKFSEVDDEIQGARDSVEQLVEEMIELNKQLLTIPIDKLSEMTTYLDGTLSDLQSIQSEYETTINTVIDLITEQQDNLEEEYNELEKSIEDQIKPLQDQLDLLGKQNDQRDRELAIENALYELEKAREQKTVQVIRDGRVQYEVDESAVRNAQQGYDDALYNKLTGDLQDKIDDLNDQLEKARESTDDQVEALEDMKKNRWETIIPDTERARNEEIATQVFTDLFGATNWKELVLAGQDARGVFADEAIYQGMRQSYGTNSEQQRDTQRQIDINNIITESLTRLVEDFQADKINSEELSAKVSTLMNFVNDGLITGQERLENTLSLGDYSNLGAALTDASRQRNDQMDIFNENLAIAQENRDQVNELITRWDDFKVWYDETYKQLYEQYKKIDFIGDTVAKWYSDGDDDDGPEYGGVWEGSNHWEEDHYYGGSGDHETGYVTFHDGLEKGSIGSLTPSDKFKAIQALGLKKLDADEFPAILHLGEGVVNRQQQSTMLDNFRSALALGGAGGTSVIQMSFGDITLPSVTNGYDFAESLATQFQPAMNQVFSKIFRR